MNAYKHYHDVVHSFHPVMVYSGNSTHMESLQDYLQAGRVSHIHQVFVLVQEMAKVLQEIHKNSFCFDVFGLKNIMLEDNQVSLFNWFYTTEY